MQSGWSTMNPDEQEVEVAMEAFLVHALRTGDGIPDTLLAKLGRLLSAVLPMPALQFVSRYSDFPDDTHAEQYQL